MIYLQNHKPIGSGQTRDCYLHPHDPTKCIKIMKANQPSDVNAREWDYYQYLIKKHVDTSHLPQCYGFIDTDLGAGLVFDFVGNSENETFLSLLEKGKLSREKASKTFNELQQYLKETNICFIDTNLNNVIIQSNQFFIIDGIVPPKEKRAWLYQKVPLISCWRTQKSLKPAKRKLEKLLNGESLDNTECSDTETA
ncbi:YrbL family protein [Salinivibrio costicola]|uniref:PhoP regulatory network protein YrbL n=1 Tax=Salinivibrio costicola subsp. alcaliphilus TaxID=272773 RepID=A0ABX3KM82_SALCS|nr:YrbL family protein [Salinivibrio costicola]OOF32811.1 hypothetical protein BZJ21_14170 [Salinivibrio costicola subsp. alcaliphilus]